MVNHFFFYTFTLYTRLEQDKGSILLLIVNARRCEGSVYDPIMTAISINNIW